MNGIDTRMGVQGVLQLRAEILQRSGAIRQVAGQPAAQAVAATPSGGFGAAMETAVRSVNGLQADSSALSAAYERGETQDIASVMLARQKASVAFEATVQVRNRLISAYRDIMNMPV